MKILRMLNVFILCASFCSFFSFLPSYFSMVQMLLLQYLYENTYRCSSFFGIRCNIQKIAHFKFRFLCALRIKFNAKFTMHTK